MAKEYVVRFVMEEHIRITHVDLNRGLDVKPEYRTRAQTASSNATGARKLIASVSADVVVASQVAQEFLSITGQNAKANKIKGATSLGGAMLAGAVAGGKVGGIFGAIGGAIFGATAGIALKAYQFEKDITEANAMANYLSEQSLTRTNNSRGNYYQWRA